MNLIANKIGKYLDRRDIYIIHLTENYNFILRDLRYVVGVFLDEAEADRHYHYLFEQLNNLGEENLKQKRYILRMFRIPNGTKTEIPHSITPIIDAYRTINSHNQYLVQENWIQLENFEYLP